MEELAKKFKDIKKVIAYVRVSTDEQVKDGNGIEIQKKSIADFCTAYDMAIMDWVIDKGKSSAKERKAFQGIIDEKPNVDAVVVAKMDRVARDHDLYYYYKFSLKRIGIDLISVAEPSIDESPAYKVYESIIAIFAEMERKTITARLTSGRKEKVLQGGFGGGKVPYGYINVEKHLVVDKYEAAVVRTVFKLRNDGLGYLRIAKTLNEMGYRTRNGKDFIPSTVKSILVHKDTYLGKYKYYDKVVKGDYEPILKEGE